MDRLECPENDIVVVDIESDGDGTFSWESMTYLLGAAFLAAFILKGKQNVLIVSIVFAPILVFLIVLAFSRFISGHRLVIDKEKKLISDESWFLWRKARKAEPFADFYGVALVEDRVQTVHGMRPRYQLFLCKYPEREPPVLRYISIVDSSEQGQKLAKRISESMGVERRNIVLNRPLEVDDYC